MFVIVHANTSEPIENNRNMVFFEKKDLLKYKKNVWDYIGYIKGINDNIEFFEDVHFFNILDKNPVTNFKRHGLSPYLHHIINLSFSNYEIYDNTIFLDKNIIDKMRSLVREKDIDSILKDI